MAKNGYPQALYDFYKSNGVDASISPGGPSLTRQEFAEECDINSLMKRYEGHGQSINHLMNMPAQGGMYVDFTSIPADLQGYMQLMEDAHKAFMTLPAVVRKEFDNDPVAFVDFAADPDNLEQMRKWELAPAAKKEEPPIQPAVAVPPAAPAVPPAAPAGPVTG